MTVCPLYLPKGRALPDQAGTANDSVTVGLVVHGCAHARHQVQCAAVPSKAHGAGLVAAELALDMLLMSSAWRQAQLLTAAEAHTTADIG